MGTMRRFVTAEVAVFGAAALVHAGVLLQGYRHRQAGVAEAVIAAVLALGIVASVVAPSMTRAAGLGVQGFALLGTFVGVTMIAIGVGPRSAFDVALHAGMIALLVTGLWKVGHARRAVA